jgi:succinyl-diaminopimelate desuccinylase
VKVEWEPVNAFRLATKVDKSELVVKAMIHGVKKATGKPPRYGGVPGSTDGTILRMELGIPIVTCGPGNRLIPHQVDEYVEANEIVDAAKIYAAASLKYLEA